MSRQTADDVMARRLGVALSEGAARLTPLVRRYQRDLQESEKKKPLDRVALMVRSC